MQQQASVQIRESYFCSLRIKKTPLPSETLSARGCTSCGVLQVARSGFSCWFCQQTTVHLWSNSTSALISLFALLFNWMVLQWSWKVRKSVFFLFRWLKGSAYDLHGTQAAHRKKRSVNNDKDLIVLSDIVYKNLHREKPTQSIGSWKNRNKRKHRNEVQLINLVDCHGILG